jgi:hypothetical protein
VAFRGNQYLTFCSVVIENGVSEEDYDKADKILCYQKREID